VASGIKSQAFKRKVIFMKKQSKRGKEERDEQMMKRLQNSLPWSLSRWLAKIWRKRK
jgi:hypothetical protein